MEPAPVLNNPELKINIQNEKPHEIAPPQSLSNHIDNKINTDNITENNKPVQPVQKTDNELSVNTNLNQKNFGYNNDCNVINIPENKSSQQDVKIEISENELHGTFTFLYLDMRSKFLIKVFGILISQLLFTFTFVLITQIDSIKTSILNHPIVFLVLLLVSLFIFLVAFTIFLCKPSLFREVPINYIFLFVVTICMTIMLICCSVLYSFQTVISALSFLIGLCISVICVVLFKKTNITACFIIFFGLIFLFITFGILALVFRNDYLLFVYCGIGVAIYSLILAFDTINIKNNFSIDDYILAALTLYFDIIRIFLMILQALGSRDR